MRSEIISSIGRLFKTFIEMDVKSSGSNFVGAELKLPKLKSLSISSNELIIRMGFEEPKADNILMSAIGSMPELLNS